MNLTLSVDDEVVVRARERAEVFGKSLNQLVREYLEELAGFSKAARIAEEFDRLSEESNGHSKGWKFNREEIHERR